MIRERNNTMIKIVCKLKVQEGKNAEVAAIAKELIEKSNADEGNVFYSLNQSISDPQCMAFIECWKDQAAIEIHNASEHFNTILPKVSALCEGTPVIDLFTEIEY